MFNPLAQIKLIADELKKGSTEDPNKLGIIEALLLKFLFAFVLVFIIYVYLDKTSCLNGRTPEENQRLFKKDYKEPDSKTDEKATKVKSTAVDPTSTIPKSRKT